MGGTLYENSRYLVWKRSCGTGECGTLWHLSIRNRANTAEHDWRDCQRIKNELVGPEAEGAELYPAESRKVDAANQFHLWVFDGQGFRFPFGFEERLVSGVPVEGGAQRPFDPEAQEQP
jgi:hypothetical protein